MVSLSKPKNPNVIDIDALAESVLLESTLTDFPIDMISLLSKKGIKLILFDKAFDVISTYQVPLSLSSFSLKQRDNFFIFYDGSIHKKMLHFVLAREYAHILLGDVKDTREVKSYSRIKTNCASLLASKILMPSGIIQSKKLLTVDAIAGFFELPANIAAARLKRYNADKQKNGGLSEHEKNYLKFLQEQTHDYGYTPPRPQKPAPKRTTTSAALPKNRNIILIDET